ncbi:alpha/beta-hydrolase [Trametes coccinea BRFM310]|uniref:Alpha/beta-hydrolase n=1 Tax=Trametes coccinea (strain BRFM310) TaxID=1353009 RepID=A0A1Y2J2E8_TRAC3|nr:alpha/beta-hydrolase [Trametes coccinea BRFM310]
MPTAPVDENGTVLFYEDAGPPAGSTDYVTVVLIHGTCFHGAVYRPMIPFAAQHNLRLVMLNLRGYPGSTEYSHEDFEQLRGPSHEQQEMSIAARGIEIAAFLRWFIETNGIPPIKDTPGGSRSGGLSLLAWSGGNCHALAMFAHIDKISAETRSLLDAYLRTFIAFDPPGSAIGYAVPPSLTAAIPQWDLSATVDEIAAIFAIGVSSYYPSYTMPATIDPPPIFDPSPVPLDKSSENPDPKYTPTSQKMPPEVLRSLMHPSIMGDHLRLMWKLEADVLKSNLRRAIFDCRFDDGTGSVKKLWPNTRVHLVLCDMTYVSCAWGATVIWLEYQKANPEHRRDLEFHKLEGVNHFVHWEEPERFTTFLANIV